MLQVTIFKQIAAKMAALNKPLRGMKVGNYKYAFLLSNSYGSCSTFQSKDHWGKIGVERVRAGIFLLFDNILYFYADMWKKDWF